MAMENKKTIFFDWDGTLYSKEVSQRANTSRFDFFKVQVDKDELIEQQHNNYNDHYALVQSLIGSALNLKDYDNIRMYQAVIFGGYYNLIVKENPESYLLVDLNKLKELKEKHNLEFVIVTSLWKGTIEGALNALNKDKIFDRVYALDVDLKGTKKDNIAQAIKDKPENTPIAMIGDRGDDLEAGKYNNLKTIFCNYGHGNVEETTITINKPEELIDAIERLV